MRTSQGCILVWLCAFACYHEPSETLYQIAEKLERQGDLGAALKRAQTGLRRYQEPGTEWHWKFRLLVAEILMDRGNPKEALSILEESAREQKGPSQKELCARWLTYRAHAKQQLGDSPAARACWQEAIRLATECGARKLLSVIDLRRAPAQATFEQRDACFRSALD